MSAADPRSPLRGATSGPAFEGIWNREFTLFKRYWLVDDVSSVVQPIIYLLAFGLGVGTLVTTVDGISYVEFVGTGSWPLPCSSPPRSPACSTPTCVASSSARTTHCWPLRSASTSSPSRKASWIAAKAGVYGTVPADRHVLLRPDADLGHAARPVHRVRHRARASRSSACGSRRSSRPSTRPRTSRAIVLTPLFLVAGTFFPISNLPPGAAGRGAVQPALPLRPAGP